MSARIAAPPDDTDWRVPPDVPGLLLDVPHEGRWRQRPSLHIEAVRPSLLRVTSGGQPLLWLHIDAWWESCGFLRGTAHGPWRLPAITSAEARGLSHAPATAAWWTSWAHRFVRELEHSEATILHAGRWCLRPLQPVPTHKAAQYPCIPTSRSGGAIDPPHSLEAALRFERFWMGQPSQARVRSAHRGSALRTHHTHEGRLRERVAHSQPSDARASGNHPRLAIRRRCLGVGARGGGMERARAIRSAGP